MESMVHLSIEIIHVYGLYIPYINIGFTSYAVKCHGFAIKNSSFYQIE